MVVIVPLWINSDRNDKTTVRESEVQAVAEHRASDAGWSLVGVTATGDQVLIEATGPTPAVRAENTVRRPDQQSCSPGHPL
jgi:hypothetical protein